VGRIGFYVPSGIHLKGVLREGEPASVLMPGPEIDPVGATVPPPQQFEVLLLPSGSISDRSGPLVDTTIEAITLNNRLLGGVCMWASGGTGFKLLQVHSQGSRQSSLIVGIWDDTVAEPQVPFRAAIYYMQAFEIARNHVHGANGDGICVIGRDGEVHHNTCENGTTLVDNGITPFIGSRNIRFMHNTIINFPTAIGLDGAFMPCAKLPDIDEPEKARAFSQEKLWELHHGWEGYHQGHEIAHNKILNCRRGIVLHRAKEINIHDNQLNGRGIREGIAIEEASHNYIWNNAVHGFETACTLYTHQHSGTDDTGAHVGASFNQVGISPDKAPAGNDFQHNQYGLRLLKAHQEGRVSHNVIRHNDCRNCSCPFDFNGGEDGPKGQFISDNQPSSDQASIPSDKIQGP
jgi:hypothetical protein